MYGSFYPSLNGIRLPPQDSEYIKKIGERSTARKDPIGSTNHQWGMKKTPTDGSFTLYLYYIL